MKLRITLGLVGLSLIASFSLQGCHGDTPDAVELSDQIAAEAMRMRRGGEARSTIEYQLMLGTASVIAIVPLSGLDSDVLPATTSAAQRRQLQDAAKMWPGREFLAIAWSEGMSSGPAIERHVVVRQQLAVEKAPHGTVTIVLERDDSGEIFLTDLR